MDLVGHRPQAEVAHHGRRRRWPRRAARRAPPRGRRPGSAPARGGTPAGTTASGRTRARSREPPRDRRPASAQCGRPALCRRSRASSASEGRRYSGTRLAGSAASPRSSAQPASSPTVTAEGHPEIGRRQAGARPQNLAEDRREGPDPIPHEDDGPVRRRSQLLRQGRGRHGPRGLQRARAARRASGRAPRTPRSSSRRGRDTPDSAQYGSRQASASSVPTPTDRLAGGERESLDRAEPDPEPGERPGTERDREGLDVGQLPPGRPEHAVDRRHQALPVGHRHAHPGLGDDTAPLEERDRPGQRRRLDREKPHASSLARPGKERQGTWRNPTSRLTRRPSRATIVAPPQSRSPAGRCCGARAERSGSATTPRANAVTSISARGRSSGRTGARYAPHATRNW